MPVFTPPVDTILPPVSDDPREIRANPLGYRLRRHYARGLVGRNVFKLVDGTYTEAQPAIYIDASATFKGDPAITVLVTYLGGHSHPVTTAEAAALTAAGYGANIV